MNLFNDSSDSEVDPLSEDLVPNAPRLEPRITETTFDGLLSAPLKLHEDLAQGCGGQIWPAGTCLSKYLLRKLLLVQHEGEQLELERELGHRCRRIVELGAGGGLVGLAIAAGFMQMCNSRSTATNSTRDLDIQVFITDQEQMIELMHRNVNLNGLTSDDDNNNNPTNHTSKKNIIHVERFDWGQPVPPPIAESPIDLILAADCVYFEPSFPLLEKTLLDLTSPTTTVYFCFKKRRRADLKFMKSISKKLHVVEITDYLEYKDCSKQSIFLYKMTRKA